MNITVIMRLLLNKSFHIDSDECIEPEILDVL